MPTPAKFSRANQALFTLTGVCLATALGQGCTAQDKNTDPLGEGAGGNAGDGARGTGGEVAGHGGRAPGTGGMAGPSGSTGGAAANGGTGGTPSKVDAGAGDTAQMAMACAANMLCDGFETYTAAGPLGEWKKNGVNGTVRVDKTHAFAGTQAIQIVSPPGGNQRTQLQRTGAPLFPATNNVLWGRVMAWAENLPGKSDKEDKNVHYDLIQASGTGPGEYRVAGMGGVLLNYEPHDCYYGTQKPIPLARWACWEWLFDGSKNVIEFYIDGVLQARVSNKGQGCVDKTDSVWAAPAFNQLRVGFVNYQSKAESTTLWIDEFAAGPSRIGCPKADASTH